MCFYLKSCGCVFGTASSQSLHQQQPPPPLQWSDPDTQHGPTCTHTHTHRDTHKHRQTQTHTVWDVLVSFRSLKDVTKNSCDRRTCPVSGTNLLHMCVCVCVSVTCHTADTAVWGRPASIVSDREDSGSDYHMVHSDCSYSANHSAAQGRRSHTGHTTHTWGQHTHCQRGQHTLEDNKHTVRLTGDWQVDPPLALPGSFRYSMKGRVQAVGVVADVTVIT